MRVRCRLTACPGRLLQTLWQLLITNCAAVEVEEEREGITLEVSPSHREARGRTTEAGESAVAATNWYDHHPTRQE